MQDTTIDLGRAARFFNATIQGALGTPRGVHADTAIAAAARMAGTMLLMSVLPATTRFAPGSPVLTEQVNVEGPALLALMQATLQQLGGDVDTASLDDVDIDLGRAQLSLLETQQRLDRFYLTYCDEERLSFREAASASAIAAGMLIHACRSVIDVRDAMALALCGLVEGAKTAPGTQHWYNVR